MSAKLPQPLATVPAALLVKNASPVEWLVEGLLLKSGAAILGGAPKSGKSFFALDLCVAVATGTLGAGFFRVAAAWPVILFCAEDPNPVLASRLSALARSRSLPLENLPIEVIVEQTVRLPEALPRLAATLARSRPGLLLLDPLIRLHRADENSATEMAIILDGLRNLARDAKTAILLVHHARKAASPSSPGSGLRGSSDLAAFADANLYLRRLDDLRLELRIEHRAAACPDPLHLRLCVEAEGSIARFQVHQRLSTAQDPSLSRLLSLLEQSPTPLSASSLRIKLGVRNQTVTAALRALLAQGSVERRGRDGWTFKRALPL
ncbi:MAG: AAA family ATPase [Vicinamibacteria bacterium]